MRFFLTESLKPGMVLARDIRVEQATHKFKVDSKLTADDIQEIVNMGYYGVYIADDFSKDVEYKQTISDALFTTAVAALESKDMALIKKVSDQMALAILEHQTTGLDLYNYRSYKEYTYFHSINVAIICLAIGKKLGMQAEKLSLLCMAAMTHDLGKFRVSQKILNKADKLTNEEYEKIKMHAQYSFDILQAKQDIPSIVKQAVLFHHENENGTGYPMGKSGNDIPLFSKIIHVADVYDALTSKRPYKQPYSPADAFEYLKGGCKILFDESIVESMYQVVPLYLPGTDVILSNGEHALIVGHTTKQKRPIVKIYKSENIINLNENEAYDKVFIVKSGFNLEEKSEKVALLNENRGEHKAFREKVLIVDDSFFTLMNAKKVLEKEYDVEMLQSGYEAINYFKKNTPPDLLVMDIQMPELDGIETVKILQKTGFDSLPIVFFTSSCDKDVVVKCLELGVIDYILKPIQPIYLKERISLALKKTYEG